MQHITDRLGSSIDMGSDSSAGYARPIE